MPSGLHRELWDHLLPCETRSGKRQHHSWRKSKSEERGLPGGSGVSSLPARAGDTGLVPGPGKSHMLWGKKAHAPQLLSLCSRAWELQLLSPHGSPRALERMLHTKRRHRNEKPCTPQLESSPLSPQLGKSLCCNEDPAPPKINT